MRFLKTCKIGFFNVERTGVIELPSLMLSQHENDKIFFLNEYNIDIRQDEGCVVFKNDEYWPNYREFKLWIDNREIIHVFNN